MGRGLWANCPRLVAVLALGGESADDSIIEM